MQHSHGCDPAVLGAAPPYGVSDHALRSPSSARWNGRGPLKGRGTVWHDLLLHFSL